MQYLHFSSTQSHGCFNHQYHQASNAILSLHLSSTQSLGCLQEFAPSTTGWACRWKSSQRESSSMNDCFLDFAWSQDIIRSQGRSLFVFSIWILCVKRLVFCRTYKKYFYWVDCGFDQHHPSQALCQSPIRQLPTQVGFGSDLCRGAFSNSQSK